MGREMHQQIDPLQQVVSERLDEEEDNGGLKGQDKERIEQFRLDEEESESERGDE